MPFNKYYTNTNILVNYLSDIEMQDLGFIDFQDFWEFSKHFFFFGDGLFCKNL